VAKRILVVGDTIIDKDVELRAIGLSLESPTLKTESTAERINFGGAANVAKYSHKFGLDVTFATTMSTENEAAFLSRYSLSLFNLDSNIENTKSRFYISHGDERYKYLQVNHTNRKELDLELNLDLNEFDIIAFSDYRCGLISNAMISNSIKSKAKTFGASQTSNKKSNFERYIDLDYLVCNKNESKSFKRRRNVLISQGKNGCKLNSISYPAVHVQNPKNLIGAGDCFYAAFLAYQSANKANKCAAEYISGLYE